MRRFLQEVRPGPDTTILDVGGSKTTSDVRYEFVVGDATALPYAEKSFDVVFLNSVIEHVGDWEKQKSFAREAARVGRTLWIQTPARSFFIEPHLIAPFIHWMPERWQKKLAWRFTVSGLMTKPSPAQVIEFLANIRLFDHKESRLLFPDCEILAERFLGMSKSYTAFRLASRPD